MYNETKISVIVVAGAIINALSLNLFLIPANVLASGFTGVSQFLAAVLGEYTPLDVSTGVLLFILNIPVVYLGWTRVGKRFTVYSLLSVIVTTLALSLIPVQSLTDKIMLNAVFGGVLAGVGVGITLKWGASTGGMDIVAMLLSRMRDQPIGVYLLVLNGLMVIAAGFFFGWEQALFTLVTLYVTSRVIDTIHTRHEKVTAMIITGKGKEIQQAIHKNMVRGITRVPAKGAFTDEDKEMLMIVITRYELYSLEQLLKEVDPTAFTNIVETAGIFGFFRTN
ncbi:YitT family protein [Tuberibacillus sp. Marseille-P3662]|uniref:YitT family protein n=1 Tax=Tuberibacillus sp. Marseille-P3662 TaxID=1965358 RepID=UPI000A1CF005|nr:YitT family protein [Tuberibacillus sp. Marseille-P3662]